MRRSSGLIVLGWFLWLGIAPAVQAHSAFYPHHLQDFGLVRSREEVRWTVLISTGVFVLLLSGVIVLALRKGHLEAMAIQRDDAQRLRLGIQAAAQAARAAWPADPKRAVEAALEGYAAATHHVWNARLPLPEQMPLRCQLGKDVLWIETRMGQKERILLLEAAHATLQMRAQIDEQGEIRYDAQGLMTSPKPPVP